MEDQSCLSEPAQVPLLRHDPVRWTDGSHALDHLGAYLLRERFESEPHVDLLRGDASLAHLTLDEAAAVAEILVALVKTARETAPAT